MTLKCKLRKILLGSLNVCVIPKNEKTCCFHLNMYNNKNSFPYFNTASALVKLRSKHGLKDALLEIKAHRSKIQLIQLPQKFGDFMIPRNLTKGDILKAIREVDGKGIRRERHSNEWSVLHNDKYYPPKYLISIANKFKNGEEWDSSKFSGGQETNQFLESIGFEIVEGGTKNSEFPVISHSWEMLSSSIVIKHLDKSAFLHHGTGVPNEIRPFFGLEDFLEGDNRPTTFLYKKNIFVAHFYVDPNERVRLHWKSDFDDVLKHELPGWFDRFSESEEVNDETPVMRFERSVSKQNAYSIEFISPDFIKQDVEAEKIEDFEPKLEGGLKKYFGKRYERDPENRKKAIEIHGTTCAVCRFDFERVYGNRGKGFIEVHHTEPLGSLSEEKIINPQTDLVPVCSNCHRMIHRRKDHVLSIAEIKKILCKNSQ